MRKKKAKKLIITASCCILSGTLTGCSYWTSGFSPKAIAVYGDAANSQMGASLNDEIAPFEQTKGENISRMEHQLNEELEMATQAPQEEDLLANEGEDASEDESGPDEEESAEDKDDKNLTEEEESLEIPALNMGAPVFIQPATPENTQPETEEVTDEEGGAQETETSGEEPSDINPESTIEPEIPEIPELSPTTPAEPESEEMTVPSEPEYQEPTAPSEPQPTEPAPTQPAPTEPAPTQPQPTEPAPTEPAPTQPEYQEPTAPSEQQPTEPAPTEPAPTQPQPTQPQPTEPTDGGGNNGGEELPGDSGNGSGEGSGNGNGEGSGGSGQDGNDGSGGNDAEDNTGNNDNSQGEGNNQEGEGSGNDNPTQPDVTPTEPQPTTPEETTPEETTTPEKTKPGKSGTFGSNGTWEIVDYVLTISGSGIIDGVMPRFDISPRVDSIVISEGVTGFALQHALYNGVCLNIYSISIPSTFTQENLSHIVNNSFSLNTIYIAPGNPIYESHGNYVTDKRTGAIVWGTDSSGIPYGYSTIGEYAYFDLHINNTVVTIPETVTYIAYGAFQYTQGYDSLYIPGSVKYIGDQAFYDACSMTSLVIGEGVETIMGHAFASCTSLRSVVIPTSLRPGSFGQWLFDGCYRLEEIYYNGGTKEQFLSIFRHCLGNGFGRVTVHCLDGDMVIYPISHNDIEVE